MPRIKLFFQGLFPNGAAFQIFSHWRCVNRKAAGSCELHTTVKIYVLKEPMVKSDSL